MAAPILGGASPAGAATASDQESTTVTWNSSGGLIINCPFSVQHNVDSGSGELSAGMSIGTDKCRGTLVISVHYVDDHGDPAQVETSSRESVLHNIFIHDAGSTAVTVDYRVELDSCASNCVHTLQTTTK